jgi:hypothetical protein
MLRTGHIVSILKTAYVPATPDSPIVAQDIPAPLAIVIERFKLCHILASAGIRRM